MKLDKKLIPSLFQNSMTIGVLFLLSSFYAFAQVDHEESEKARVKFIRATLLHKILFNKDSKYFNYDRKKFDLLSSDERARLFLELKKEVRNPTERYKWGSDEEDLSAAMMHSILYHDEGTGLPRQVANGLFSDNRISVSVEDSRIFFQSWKARQPFGRATGVPLESFDDLKAASTHEQFDRLGLNPKYPSTQAKIFRSWMITAFFHDRVRGLLKRNDSGKLILNPENSSVSALFRQAIDAATGSNARDALLGIDIFINLLQEPIFPGHSFGDRGREMQNRLKYEQELRELIAEAINELLAHLNIEPSQFFGAIEGVGHKNIADCGTEMSQQDPAVASIGKFIFALMGDRRASSYQPAEEQIVISTEQARRVRKFLIDAIVAKNQSTVTSVDK